MKKTPASVYIGAQPTATPQQASVFIGAPQAAPTAAGPGSVFIGAPQAPAPAAAPSVFMGAPGIQASQLPPAAASQSVTKPPEGSISKAPAAASGSQLGKAPAAASASQSKAPAAASGSQLGKAPAAASASQTGKAPAAASASQLGKAPEAASASQSKAPAAASVSQSKAPAAASGSQLGKAPAAASASQTGKAPAAASASQLGKAPEAASASQSKAPAAASASQSKAPAAASVSQSNAPAAASGSQLGKAPAAASASQTGKAPAAAGASQVSAMPIAAAASMAGGKATDDVISQIEAAYKTLQAATDCKSLLKKCFTEQVKDALKARKTKMGATLIDVIQSGVKNLDSGVGVYAPDAESYTTFKELFDPICEAYHGFKLTDKQPPVDLGESHLAELVNLDPDNKFIVSTRIRCGRSIQGYQFNPCLTEANYKEMETKMQALFKNIPDPELQGTYYPLTGMSKDVQNQLIKDHFLFKEGDRFLQHANACRYWPSGRGIFHNKDKTFLVWVNEEDHLRIISMQPGGDVGKVLDRLIRGVKIIEKQMPFSRDERLGWLTFCPTNLGTTIRASVHVKIPKTSAKPEFKTICDEMKLQIRGIHGEHSETEGGVYDISNKRRLGFSEYEVIKQMYDGVKKLVELEKAG